MLALLRESRSLGPLGIGLGEIGLSTNRIKVELRVADDGGEGLWIAFEERSGHLAAHLAAPGWQPRLSDARNRALTTALAGLYKMSGVDLVRIPPRSSPSAPTDGHHDGSRLIAFDRVVVPWRRWVEAWERDQAGGDTPHASSKASSSCPLPAVSRTGARRHAAESGVTAWSEPPVGGPPREARPRETSAQDSLRST